MKPLIRTLAAEDEPAARDALAMLLRTDPELELVGTAVDGPETVAAIQAHGPHLVFLDVQMPGMDGFAVLRQIQPAAMPVVVFVTAHDAFALRAFDVSATDYLLKPYSDARLNDAIARAKRRVREGDAETQVRLLLRALDQPREPASRLMVRQGSRMMVLDQEELDWAQVNGDNLHLHVGKRIHVIRKSLADLETSLDPDRFLRIHRSALINLDRVASLEPYYRGEYVAVLRDGTRVKVARNCRERLLERLGREL
jgi:two-component system LytT family response regulator